MIPTGYGVNVSVIVPAYNAERCLPDCLVALVAQDYPRDRYEVIVVDDGSTDGTTQVAARDGVIRLRQPHLGPAAARNTGIRLARGDLLLFTDADCAPAPDWISAMVETFANPSVAGCKGVYRTSQRSLVARFVQVEYEEKYAKMQFGRPIDFVDTYSAAYRKTVLMREGVFDERITAPSVEDIELSFRLAERGHKLWFNPWAVVYHYHPETIGGYLRRKLRYGSWRFRVYQRYPDKVRGDSHTPRILWVQLVLAALILACLPVALVIAAGRWILAATCVAFLVTTLPFVLRCLRTDTPVALLAPLLLWLRATALGLGLAHGIVHYLTGQLSRRESVGDHVG